MTPINKRWFFVFEPIDNRCHRSGDFTGNTAYLIFDTNQSFSLKLLANQKVLNQNHWTFKYANAQSVCFQNKRRFFPKIRHSVLVEFPLSYGFCWTRSSDINVFGVSHVPKSMRWFDPCSRAILYLTSAQNPLKMKTQPVCDSQVPLIKSVIL